MSTPMIQIDQLTKEFAGVLAVDNVSFAVSEGAIYGLLGPTGAGKTTVIQLLLGLITPTSGSAQVLGYNVLTDAAAIRGHTGALMSEIGLYEQLSAEYNLDFYGRIWHVPAADRKVRIRELLTYFDLWERRTELVHSWSQPMKVRLGLARMLLHRPSLVFVDAPTAGLEPDAVGGLYADLVRLARNEGLTVLMTSDNPAEAGMICHRLGVLSEGRLVVEGEPADLCEACHQVQLEIVGGGFSADMIALVQRRRDVVRVLEDVGRLWVYLKPESHSAPVLNLLVESGAEIEEVHRNQVTLDTLYHSLFERRRRCSRIRCLMFGRSCAKSGWNGLLVTAM